MMTAGNHVQHIGLISSEDHVDSSKASRQLSEHRAQKERGKHATKIQTPSRKSPLFLELGVHVTLPR